MNLQHKLIGVIALAGLLLSSPLALSSGEVPGFHSSLWSSKATLVLPFELINNQIVVRLSLNGTPGSFILDSGTEHITLDRKAADAAHLRILPNSGNLNTLGKPCAIETSANGIQIKYGKIELAKGIAPVIDMSQLERGLGFPIEGIIGFDFIRRFPLLLDYGAKTITVFADKKVQYRGEGASIPVLNTEAAGEPPRLPVVVSKLELPDGSQADAKLEIDTGYYGVLDLHAPFVQKHPSIRVQPTAIPLTPPPNLQTGCGDSHEDVRGQVSAIQLGGIRFAAPEALYAKEPAGLSTGDETDGELGNRFLSQFRVFFDIPAYLIVLDR
jgi:hypothetical protein